MISKTTFAYYLVHMERDVPLSNAWKELLKEELTREYFPALTSRVRQEYLTRPVYPHPSRVFRAFELTEPHDIRVVILGQDPYHTRGVADGLAFSTLPGNRIPPSLVNIFKEIETEYGVPCEQNPNLERWARQGVLLLNAALSVREGEANSHADYGWHAFTDAVVASISRECEHVVFILWGAHAGKKEHLIDWTKHLVLMSVHPSPLSASRGFFGNNHFKQANEYLEKHGRGVVDWR